MRQRGQSSLEYVALLALIGALLTAAVATAHTLRIAPDVLSSIRAILGDGDGTRAQARAETLALAAGALSGSGAATSADAWILLRHELGAVGGSEEFERLALATVHARRPDLFTPQSYDLVPNLSDGDLRGERHGVLLRRRDGADQRRSVEEPRAGGRPEVRLLAQADESAGLRAAAHERRSSADRKAWLSALAPIAVVAVAAVAPEAGLAGAVAGPEVVVGAGKIAMNAVDVDELVAKVRAGQHAVYPPATRRGDIVVCVPVTRTNRAGLAIRVPGASYSNMVNSSLPIATSFSLWHSVVLRSGVVIDEEVTRESACEAGRTW